MQLKVWAVLLSLVMSPITTVFAQETPVLPVQLTSGSLEKFIATFPSLSDAYAESDPEYDVTDPDSLIGQIALMIEGDHDGSALDKAAVANGYQSFDEWGNIATNVLLARLWAENPPDEAEIATSEAEINALADITEDEKKQMIAGLHEAMGSAHDKKPSDANIETVRPFLGKLSALLGSEG